MPTVKLFGACKIAIYADDHNPPHFHLLARDWAAKFAISDGRHLAGTYSAREAMEALAWASRSRDHLLTIWMKLNERET
jgi:hypothetical protein